MGLREARREAYLETVWAIAASRYVEQFIIGYTYRSGAARFAEYKINEYEHMVILADRLTSDDAHSLEEYLQLACRNDKRHAAWRKYHAYYRKLHYRTGRKSPTPNRKIHSVYMVWWEP